MKIKRWHLNLSLFDGDGGNGGGDGGGQGGNHDGGTQPFKAFANEADFTAHVTSLTGQGKADFLKGLGFENEDDLQAIIKAHKDNEDKNKSDLEKEQNARTKAEEERNTAVSAANKAIRDAEGYKQAVKLGISPDHIDDALKLAGIESMEVKDGKIDGDAVNKAIAEVLKRLPGLAGEGNPAAGGGEFDGGKGGTVNPWKSESFNLTAQGKLIKENPTLAAQLMREAGITQ